MSDLPLVPRGGTRPIPLSSQTSQLWSQEIAGSWAITYNWPRGVYDPAPFNVAAIGVANNGWSVSVDWSQNPPVATVTAPGNAALEGQYTVFAAESGGSQRALNGSFYVVRPGVGDLQGYIEGLELVWLNNLTLGITSGAAYIPALGRVYEVSSDLYPSLFTVSYPNGVDPNVQYHLWSVAVPSWSGTWAHVYLYDNNGTPGIEISANPPQPYRGSARRMGTDGSRRYLGSILGNGTRMYNFLMQGKRVLWREPGYTGTPSATNPFRVAYGEYPIPTGPLVLDINNGVPLTARMAQLYISNLSDASAIIGNSDASPSPGITYVDPVGTIAGAAYSGTVTHAPMFPLDALRQAYLYLQGTRTFGGVYIDVLGYEFER